MIYNVIINCSRLPFFFAAQIRAPDYDYDGFYLFIYDS